MKLHDAPRSSACYRVRIALHWKGIPFEKLSVDLLRDGGEQHHDDYRAVNPQGLVPTLRDGPVALRQSLAIIEYLEETHPEPRLLPQDPVERAHVRAMAQLIACDVHPLNNLRVLRYLEGTLGLGDETRLAWYRHWIAEGLTALESLVAKEATSTSFCFRASPSLADLCLVPQIFNARRYDCPLEPYPTLCRIDAACRELPAFRAAHPEAE